MTTAFTAPASNGRLPDLSYMMKVAQLRCIQSSRESGECWNPDLLVERFLSPLQRWSCFWRGGLLLERLRADPFYYYIVARTRSYDEVFLDAVFDGMQQIISVGCGSDTRAYRFAHLLSQKGVRVLECDQAAAIEAKEHIARARLPASHVDFAAIDLNQTAWPDLERRIERLQGRRALVLMEGVSPYVEADCFGAFLRMLSRHLGPGSRVAYDFKIRGADDAFGRSEKTHRPFRLSAAGVEIEAYHAAQGFAVRHAETSSDLSTRLLPASGPEDRFAQDALVQLDTTGAC